MQLSRLVLAGAIAACSLLLGSAADPESVAAESATPVVRGVSIFGRAFNPPVYRVPANSPIRWLNGDRVVHNITTVGEPPVAFAFTLPARGWQDAVHRHGDGPGYLSDLHRPGAAAGSLLLRLHDPPADGRDADRVGGAHRDGAVPASAAAAADVAAADPAGGVDPGH